MRTIFADRLNADDERSTTLWNIMHNGDSYVQSMAEAAYARFINAFTQDDGRPESGTRHRMKVYQRGGTARSLLFQAVIRANRYDFIRSMFWKLAHKHGCWIRNLGLSDAATCTLQRLARRDTSPCDPDTFNHMLYCLILLPMERRAVINAVIEAADPDDKKSVDAMLQTVQELSLLCVLPHDHVRDFYRRIGTPAGDIHAHLQNAVRYEFNSFIRNRTGDSAPIRVLLPRDADEAEAGISAAPDARSVERVLHDSGVTALFAASATFMDEQGLRILTSLIEDLAFSRVDGDGIDYDRRYARMIERLGFDPAFVERWKKDWRCTIDNCTTEITGRPEVFAWHGIVPVSTCQRLTRLYDPETNGRGQPINRLRWGHIKVANHFLNGTVVCKRIIEVTREPRYGQEFLRVGPLYFATSGNTTMLDLHIDRYAEELGIPPSHVSYPERDRGLLMPRVPGPLHTGDEIVHDSGHPEIDPITLMSIATGTPPIATGITSPAALPWTVGIMRR